MNRTTCRRLFAAAASTLAVSAFAEGFQWTGAVNGIWDLTSLNWALDGMSSSFSSGGDATFDASATTKDITISEGLVAGTVVFDGAADYTLRSTHGTQDSWTECGLKGATRIEKRGTGTLTVHNMHGFTGDIDIYGGTYKAGDGTVDKVNGRPSPLGDVRTKRTITVHEGVAFVREVDVPSVKVMLDTFHMNIEEDSIGGAIRATKGLLGHFHTGECNRRVPGRGRTPWAEIGAALSEIGYVGNVAMEPFVVPGGKVGEDIKIWRTLESDVSEAALDAAAREALAFERKVLG